MLTSSLILSSGGYLLITNVILRTPFRISRGNQNFRRSCATRCVHVTCDTTSKSFQLFQSAKPGFNIIFWFWLSNLVQTYCHSVLRTRQLSNIPRNHCFGSADNFDADVWHLCYMQNVLAKLSSLCSTLTFPPIFIPIDKKHKCITKPVCKWQCFVYISSFYNQSVVLHITKTQQMNKSCLVYKSANVFGMQIILLAATHLCLTRKASDQIKTLVTLNIQIFCLIIVFFKFFFC